MLEAVLFDWGNTLARFEWDDELLAAGHRAGLAAVGGAAEAGEFTRRFHDEIRPRLTPDDDYVGILRDELGLSETDAERFLLAEHEVWRPATALAATAHALLESLRGRGLRLAVVANHWPEPAWLVRRNLEELGIAARVDAIVLAGEVGARKPDPAIFEHALATLGVEAFDAMFVGDRLDADIRGAGELGMITVQALWFEADEPSGGIEPDFMAFTPMDVLGAVRRVAVHS